MIAYLKKRFLERSATEHTVIKNTGWLFVGEVGSRIARGALAIIAARMLGVSGLGAWSYAVALSGFFTFFEDAGIGMFVTREFAKGSDSKESIFSTAIVLKLGLLALAIALFLGIGPLISDIPEATAILPIVALVFVFDSLRGFFFSISRAEQKMDTESKVQIVTSLLVVGLGVLFMLISPTPLSLALGYAAGGGIGCLLIFLSVKKYIPNLVTFFSKQLFVHIFKSAWPFTILAISNIVIFSTDTILLGHFASVHEVGLYGAASRLVQIFYILPALFATVTFPVFVKKSVGETGIWFALRKSLLLMTAVMIPLVLVMMFGSHLIIKILFGAEYAPAGILLAVLSLSYIPVFIGTLLNNVVFAENKQKQFVVANIIGMVINLILNLILIPKYHALGACVSTVTALSVITAITAIKMRFSK